MTKTDEGATSLYCSNCKAHLCEIWTRDASADQNTKIKSLCGGCGDHSYIKHIKGTYYIGSTDESSIEDISYSEVVEDGKIVRYDVVVKTIASS